jgi:polyphosphate glucokinase
MSSDKDTDTSAHVLGIDIGGSGIKGAVVDITSGDLVTQRFRVPTPQPSKPAAVAGAVAEVARHFNWHGPIGCTFPAVIQHGVALSAANVDKRWIGTNGDALFEQATGCPVLLLNDADAAGLAEMRFGAGRGELGVVFMITLGTGVGSALFYRGVLVPNTELGHLEIRGKDAESRTSARAKEERGWTWEQWATRLDEHLAVLEKLFTPDLFIIGGGVSKEHARFLPLLQRRARVIPAEFFNEAGIVGAALAASEGLWTRG